MTILATEWHKWLRHRFTQGCIFAWLLLLLFLIITDSNLVVLTSIGQLLSLIWISTIIGSEFQWGTLRTFLVNGGISRVKFGVSWLGVIVSSSLFLTISLTIMVALITILNPQTIGIKWLLQNKLALLGTFFSFLVYASIGFGLTTYSQSTQSALLLSILGFAFEWFIETILRVLTAFCGIESAEFCVPISNLARLFHLYSVRVNANLVVNELSESWMYAFNILCVYIATILIVSLFGFAKRDLNTL